MTHVLRIAHLRIALHVANPEVGNREGIHTSNLFERNQNQDTSRQTLLSLIV